MNLNLSTKDNIQKPRKLFASHILRKIFLEDWGIKLLALGITLALWLGVTGLSTPTTKRFSSVPLNLDISSDAQIVNTPPQEVTIEVSGDKRLLNQINRLNLSASIDLSDMKPGEWVVSLSPDIVNVPLERGITLTDVAPGRIPVNIEAVEEKEIKVNARTIGTVAQGFEVYSLTTVPAKIRVRGPASVVRVLENVQTDIIDVTGRKESFTDRQIAVTSPNPQAAVLNTVVDVFFRIGERRVERFIRVPVLNDDKDASMVLFGPRSMISKLKAEDIKVEMVLGENGEEVPVVTLPLEIRDIAEVRSITLSEKPGAVRPGN